MLPDPARRFYIIGRLLLDVHDHDGLVVGIAVLLPTKEDIAIHLTCNSCKEPPIRCKEADANVPFGTHCHKVRRSSKSVEANDTFKVKCRNTHYLTLVYLGYDILAVLSKIDIRVGDIESIE